MSPEAQETSPLSMACEGLGLVLWVLGVIGESEAILVKAKTRLPSSLTELLLC